ncbi:MAG: hypothetical protein MHPSP_003727, partial [Paramarteilia canceri]
QLQIYDIIAQKKSVVAEEIDKFNLQAILEECEIVLLFIKGVDEKIKSFDDLSRYSVEIRYKISEMEAKKQDLIPFGNDLSEKVCKFANQNVFF